MVEGATCGGDEQGCRLYCVSNLVYYTVSHWIPLPRQRVGTRMEKASHHGNVDQQYVPYLYLLVQAILDRHWKVKTQLGVLLLITCVACLCVKIAALHADNDANVIHVKIELLLLQQSIVPFLNTSYTVGAFVSSLHTSSHAGPSWARGTSADLRTRLRLASVRLPRSYLSQSPASSPPISSSTRSLQTLAPVYPSHDFGGMPSKSRGLRTSTGWYVT